ncbi:hypothetical protein ACH5RR_008759 [Cinchona calisaya]|uniref:Uncharacterized protein n=1 Tax=Cinchona calisaya TaxID=153742 RepID=A0ABD3ACJ1_9GENT
MFVGKHSRRQLVPENSTQKVKRIGFRLSEVGLSKEEIARLRLVMSICRIRMHTKLQEARSTLLKDPLPLQGYQEEMARRNEPMENFGRHLSRLSNPIHVIAMRSCEIKGKD